MERNIKEKIIQTEEKLAHVDILLRVRERIVFLHLMDYTNVAIADSTKVKYHVVERIVNDFKKQVQSKPYFPEQIDSMKRMEKRLFELAVKKMTWAEEKEYAVLKSCYASADINNFSVFAP